MEKRKKSRIAPIASLAAGTAFAIGMSVPYIVFRAQLRQLTMLGYLGVFLFCAVSNCSIFLPTSSTLIVVAASSALHPAGCILLGGMGTALGEQTSYLCGKIGAGGFDEYPDVERRLASLLCRNGFLTVFLFGVLPLPVFDFVGIAAGAARMDWLRFTLAAVSGKMVKYSLSVVSVYFVFPRLLPYISSPGHIILERFLSWFGV